MLGGQRALPFLEWWQPSGMNAPLVPPMLFRQFL